MVAVNRRVTRAGPEERRVARADGSGLCRRLGSSTELEHEAGRRDTSTVAIPGWSVGPDGVTLSLTGRLTGDDEDELVEIIDHLFAAGRMAIDMELWELRGIDEEGVAMVRRLGDLVRVRGGTLRVDSYPNALVSKAFRAGSEPRWGWFNDVPLDPEMRIRFKRLRASGVETVRHLGLEREL